MFSAFCTDCPHIIGRTVTPGVSENDAWVEKGGSYRRSERNCRKRSSNNMFYLPRYIRVIKSLRPKRREGVASMGVKQECVRSFCGEA